MNKIKQSEPIGLLHANSINDNFSLTRFTPQEHLQDYVEHYWYISWDLPNGKTHEQSVIPHPNTHLSFVKGNSRIQGICKAKYTHTLQGKGNILGIKFKPAGFYPFLQQTTLNIKDICDQVISIDSVFDICVEDVEQHVLGLPDPQQKIQYIDTLLFSSHIDDDSHIRQLNEMVSTIANDNSMMKVTDLCERYQLDVRTIQRLFAKYIGISAKWIIKRYRIHDALVAIDNHEHIDWSILAVDLGYYDQAHFITDFKNIVGQTPKLYKSAIK